MNKPKKNFFKKWFTKISLKFQIGSLLNKRSRRFLSCRPNLLWLERRLAPATHDTLNLAYAVDLSPEANSITLNGTIATFSDAELYKIHLFREDKITAETNTKDSPGLDTFLRIFDTAGTQIKLNDDLGQGNSDSLLTYTIPKTGDYFIGVSGSGNPAYDPRFTQRGTIASSKGNYDLRIDLTPGPRKPLHDTLDSAIPFMVDYEGTITLTGELEEKDQVDFYKTTLNKNDFFSVEPESNSTDLINPNIFIFSENGVLIYHSDFERASISFVSFQVPESKTYYIGISSGRNFDYNTQETGTGKNGHETGKYSLLINAGIAHDTLENASAQQVSPGSPTTVDDVFIESSQVNLYSVEGKKGQILKAITPEEALSSRTFTRFFDASGKEIAREFKKSGSELDGQVDIYDGQVAIKAEYDGIFFIGISSGSNKAYDPKTRLNRDKGDYYLGNYQVRFEIVDPPEPSHDTIETAIPLEMDQDKPIAQQGSIFYSQQVDLYQITLRSDKVVKIALYADGYSNLKATLRIFDEKNKDFLKIAKTTNGTTSVSFILTTKTERTLIIGVSSFQNDSYEIDPLVPGKGGVTYGTYYLNISILDNDIGDNQNVSKDISFDTNQDFKINSAISALSDKDFYAFELFQGDTFHFKTISFQFDNPDDLLINIYNLQKQVIFNNNDYFGLDPEGVFVAPYSGKYFLEIAAANHLGFNSDNGLPFIGIKNYLITGERSGNMESGQNSSLVSADIIKGNSSIQGSVDYTEEKFFKVTIPFSGNLELRLSITENLASNPLVLLGNLLDENGSVLLDFNNRNLSSQYLTSGIYFLKINCQNKDSRISFVINTKFTESLQPFEKIGFGLSIETINVADLTGDGVPDIIGAGIDPSGEFYSICTLIGLGNGLFSKPFVCPLPKGGDAGFNIFNSTAFHSSIEDLNNDGILDFLLNISNSDYDTTLFGNKNGFPTLSQNKKDHSDKYHLVDLNNDGILDTIILNSNNTNDIQITLTGNGSSQKIVFPEPDFEPTNFKVADLNNDGNLDLIVTWNHLTKYFFGFESKLQIYLGSKDGKFTALDTLLVTSSGSLNFSIFDFNRDLIPDLILENSNNHQIFIYMGNGDGSYKISNITKGSQSNKFYVDYIDNDKYLDIAYANSGESLISILLGNGDGTFKDPLLVSLAYKSNAFQFGDFNTDGNLDLFTISGTTTLLTISGTTTLLNGIGNCGSIAFGRGDGTFQTAANLVGRNPIALISGDFNRDGTSDLVTANYADNSVSVLLGKGNGSIQSISNYPTGFDPFDVAEGDFNNDGKPDLVTINAQGFNYSYSVLLGLPGGLLKNSETTTLPQKPLNISVFTFRNQKGSSHTSIIIQFDDGSASLFYYQPNGTLASPKNGWISGFSQSGNYYINQSGKIIVNDFNHDGYADIAFVGSSANGLELFLSNGSSSDLTTAFIGLGQSASNLTFFSSQNQYNMNQSILVKFSTGFCQLLYNLGDGLFFIPKIISVDQSDKTLFPIPASKNLIDFSDYNSDGLVDFIIANKETRLGTVYLSDKGKIIILKIQIDFNIEANLIDLHNDVDIKTNYPLYNLKNIYFGNFSTTDKKLGLFSFYQDPSTGYLRTYFSSLKSGNIFDDKESGIFNKQNIVQTPSNPPSTSNGQITRKDFNVKINGVAKGDFNGDGSLDLATINQGTFIIGPNKDKYEFYSYSILLGRGDGSFLSPKQYPLSERPVCINYFLFNDQPRVDQGALIIKFANNDVSVRYSKDNGEFFSPESILDQNVTMPFSFLETKGGVFAVDDFNGDGFADFAISEQFTNRITLYSGLTNGLQKFFPIDVSPNLIHLYSLDINQDSFPDLVAIFAESKKVYFYPGKGDCTFDFPISIDLPIEPSEIKFKKNIINNHVNFCVLSLSGGLSTYEVDYNFSVKQTGVLSFNNPSKVSYFDFVNITNDSVSDVYVIFENGFLNQFILETEFNSGIVTNVDVQFLLPRITDLPTIPPAVLDADFNGDGKPDLVTADFQNNSVSVFVRQNYGEISKITSSDAFNIYNQPQFHDFNGDGNPDLVIGDNLGNIFFRPDSHQNKSMASLSIINPGTHVKNLISYRSSTGWGLAGIESSGNSISVFPGDSLQGFLGKTDEHGHVVNPIIKNQPIQLIKISTGKKPSLIQVKDLNGDNLDDLIITNGNDNSITIAFQDSKGGFAQRFVRSVGTNPTSVTFLQSSSDPLLSIIIGNQGSGDFSVLSSSPEGPYLDQQRFRTGQGVSGRVTTPNGQKNLTSQLEPTGIAIADFSFQGSQDLVVLNRGSRKLSLIPRQTGNLFFLPDAANDYITSALPGQMVVLTLPGDTRPSIALLMEDRNEVWLYRNHQNGIFAQPDGMDKIPVGPDSNGLSVATVQGKMALIVGNKFGDILTLIYDSKNGFSPDRTNLNLAPLALGKTESGQQYAIVADQKTDRLSVYYRTPGKDQFDKSRSIDTTAEPLLAPGTVQMFSVNGVSYLVVANSLSNNIQLFKGDGSGSFQVLERYGTGTNPVSVSVSDINGDTIPDLVVANKGSNDVSVFLGDTSSGSWGAVPYQRLPSGGNGPISVALKYTGKPQGPDLQITNSDGIISLLGGIGVDGKGSGFFQNTPQANLNFGSGIGKVIPLPGGDGLSSYVLGINGSVSLISGNLVTPFITEGVKAISIVNQFLVAGFANGTIEIISQDNEIFVESATGFHGDISALEALENGIKFDVFATESGGESPVVLTLSLPISNAEVPKVETTIAFEGQGTNFASVTLVLVATLVPGKLVEKDLASTNEESPDESSLGSFSPGTIENFIDASLEPINEEINPLVDEEVSPRDPLTMDQWTQMKALLLEIPEALEKIRLRENLNSQNKESPEESQEESAFNSQFFNSLNFPMKFDNDELYSTALVLDQSLPAFQGNETRGLSSLGPWFVLLGIGFLIKSLEPKKVGDPCSFPSFSNNGIRIQKRRPMKSIFS